MRAAVTKESAVANSASSTASGSRARISEMPRKSAWVIRATLSADSSSLRPHRTRSWVMSSATSAMCDVVELDELALRHRIPHGEERELHVENRPVLGRSALAGATEHEREEIGQAGLGGNLRGLHGGPQRLHLPRVAGLEKGEEEILLVLEVGVHGTLAEAGGGRHRVEGRPVEAPLGEDLGGGRQQVLPGLLATTLRGEGFEGGAHVDYRSV